MSYKQRNFVLIVLALLLILMLVTFFYSIYAKMIDKSSYTDWISAFCNVVMAGATVGAVITARNYLAQFTAQEGYKLAIKLVNEDFPKIRERLSIINREYVKIDKFLDALNAETVISDVTVLNLTNQLSMSSSKIIDIKKVVSSHLDSIKTYGLVMEQHRYKDFTLAMSFIECNIDECFGYIAAIEKYLDKIKIRNEPYYFDNDILKVRDVSEKIDFVIKTTEFDLINTITKRMVSQSALAVKSFERVVGEPKHITKIFMV